MSSEHILPFFSLSLFICIWAFSNSFESNTLQFFLKTQRCKFGSKCKFNHPKVSSENDDVTSGLPDRPSEPPCSVSNLYLPLTWDFTYLYGLCDVWIFMQFYMKTGKCKFGASCKFHHPKDIQIQSSDELSHTAAQTEINSMIGGALGDTQPIKSLISPSFQNSKGLPVRLVNLYPLVSVLWSKERRINSFSIMLFPNLLIFPIHSIIC